MLYNYLKIAVRNLRKYRFISFVNLFGLTVGLACCLLITTYIIHELSYDRYHSKADRIYRISRQFNGTDGKVWLHLGTISPPFGPLLTNDFPEIEHMTRLLQFGVTPVKKEDKILNEKDVFVADDEIFNVFDVELIQGDPRRALHEPFSIILTEEKARKYFGNANPVGQSIRMFNQYDLKVTGVYKEFPSNAHLHPGMMISFSTLRDSSIYGEENLRSNWGNNSFFTYVLLPQNYQASTLEAKFPAFLDKHFPMGKNPSSKASQVTALHLQKLTDIHLRSHLDYEAEENGDIKRVYIFSAIALFILLIACINYMNLSTARSALRAREIGIRKVAGAQRKEIVLQFLTESVLISLVAMLLAIGLCWMALPALNKLSGLNMNMQSLLKPAVVIPVLLLPFFVGIVSGLYPALFMSSFQPVKVLKGLFKMNHTGFSFRQVLVVIQFAVSIILIVSTVVIYQQLSYIQNKAMGYDRDHVLTIPYDNSLNPQYEAFRNELMSNTSIKEATRSTRIPTGRLLDAQNASVYVGDSAMPVKQDIKMVSVDYDFVPTYNIQIAAGRNFSRSFGTDTAAFLMNESAATAIGWKKPEDAIGKPMMYGNIKGAVIGVMKDIHFESLHEKITPLILLLPSAQAGGYNQLSVKLAGNTIPQSIAFIERTWKKFLPQTPFEYNFLDESFQSLYKAERVQGQLFTLFACFAIFIACLGLFGLSAFTITQRIKEIGIRKVLGANVKSIVGLLSRDFLKLVLIAALIAFPVAWLAMTRWLQDFAYRDRLHWWVFVSAGIIAAMIALITISFQAIKAATANPVKSLKNE